jgi:TonB family protein
MQAKSLFVAIHLSLMALSAGALHAAEANQAGKPYDCPIPVLPIAAVRDNLSGDVTLEYQANEQGRFAGIRVLKSSGHRALDKAALVTLSRCKLPVPAAGEAPPSGTMEFKFGEQVRVAKSSPPVLIPGSCAASDRFTTYVASTYDRVEAPGVSIRFGVSAAGEPTSPASYEHDQALAAEAIAYIQSCRFTPATVNGAPAAGKSDGFIRVKAAAP